MTPANKAARTERQAGAERLRLFVACAPGLEDLLVEELTELGVEEAVAVPGGASCFGDLDTLYRINLGSGLGLRVLVRVAEFFVRDFAKLERVAADIEWERYLGIEEGVRVRAHSKRSRLYHTKAIAQRVERGIVARLGGRGAKVDVHADTAVGPGGGELGSVERQPTLVQVRMVRDRCTISVDTTGTMLHKRGWRAATAKAPLREDIARALLRLSGWTPGMALFDPATGSGTLVIEAATIAMGRPPGDARSFAFVRQPSFDAARFEAQREGLRGPAHTGRVTLLGCDRNEGAVEAANGNAGRAGVEGLVEFVQRSVGAAELPTLEGAGVVLIANPPWGRRTGDRGRLRNLYASLGNLARRLPRPTRIALVTSDASLAGATGLGLERRVDTDHGGVKISLWTGVVE